MTGLDDWARAFHALDRACPWPGPRPLDHTRPEDQKLLIGRTADEEAFSDDVLSHSLVVLTADSGVGKSSLLEIGLTRRLEEEGFIPLLCKRWTIYADGDTPEQFLLRNLESDLPRGIQRPEGSGDPSLCSQLDRRYGERAVLVLDQFEELIRYRPLLANEVLDWIAEINQRHDTHVVLSLRAEYTHRLRTLESRVRPFSMATYVLEALDDLTSVEEVVASGNLTAAGSIHPKAIKRLAGYWVAVASEAKAAAAGVGLLQLQATMYALHARTEGMIEQGDVEDMIDEAAEAGEPLYTLATKEAVRTKLDRCRDACRHPGLPEPLDEVLVEGTMGMLQRISGQLSSGGYKLVREEWEVATKTLGREIDRLGLLRPEEARPLYLDLVGEHADGHDLLTHRQHVVVDDTSETSPHLAAIDVTPAPWQADPDELSSGAMFGMAPRSILVEELRRFAFALQWLRAASIVRVSSPAAGQKMLALVHDGFGEALDAWSADHRAGPSRAIHLLTAAYGERFDWQSDRSDVPVHPELDGKARRVRITNARWRDCVVSATFRRVVFVNCDFRGTRFEHCGFRGVTFVNCLLDGATFGECTIYGKATDALVDQSLLPDFKVEVDPKDASAISRYRGLSPTDGDHLYSRTSGVPAVPWRPSMGEGQAWKPQDQGVAMYGGRLSSLMIRACEFVDGGLLALRYIAGSSLDVVEQKGGRIDAFDSAIRGLTVTRHVEEVSEEDTDDSTGGSTTFELTVRSSIVANSWFGPALVGSARFEDCLLVQLMNLSDRERFDVVLRECGYAGATNIDPSDDGSGLRPEFQVDAMENREEIARRMLRMDYRSTPARLELDP